jgi:hypothetical protein
VKLRKTRIKKTTKASGGVEYSAQYKYGWWWEDFSFVTADSVAEYVYRCWRKNILTQILSEENAKDLIDKYISYVNHKYASSLENEVVKVEYEGYP